MPLHGQYLFHAFAVLFVIVVIVAVVLQVAVVHDGAIVLNVDAALLEREGYFFSLYLFL